MIVEEEPFTAAAVNNEEVVQEEIECACCVRTSEDWILCRFPCFSGFTSCYVICSLICMVGVLVVIGLGFWTVWRH